METYVGFNMKKSKETTLKPEKALEQDTTAPGPKWKPRYWSCKMWSSKSVSDILKGK
jgi:hypothetical protein